MAAVIDRTCVCVFAKPPRAGLVKTRLVAELGRDGAARLARAFFEDTWASLTALDWADVVLATTDTAAAEWRAVAVRDIWPQGGGTLGRRMERVLQRALTTHARAIAVGTDSPGLPPAIMAAARDALASHDAVIGPSDDGGFYLIGLRRHDQGLFDGVPWSTDETCARTADRLRARGYSLATLPPWFDVDRPADVRRLHAMRDRLATLAPATAHVLGELQAHGLTPAEGRS